MRPGFVLPQEEIDESVAERVGGKALSLAHMARAGIAVPAFVAIATDAYEAYLDASKLRARTAGSSSCTGVRSWGMVLIVFFFAAIVGPQVSLVAAVDAASTSARMRQLSSKRAVACCSASR